MTDNLTNLDLSPLYFWGVENVCEVRPPGPLGLGFRETDGTLYFVGLPYARLTNAQVLKVIAGAQVPLPGWPKGVPPGWLDGPWLPMQCLHQKFTRRSELHAVAHELVARPRSVRRAFNSLLVGTHPVLHSLIRWGTKAQIDELWTKAKKLKAASLSPEAESLGCNLEKMKAAIDKHVARFEFAADYLSRKPTTDRPLQRLTPDLVHCFERVFCRPATGGWKKRGNAPADDADSPYVRFAQAYLSEIGCSHRPLTIQKALYEWRKEIRPLP
jgi:hypothetical protein